MTDYASSSTASAKSIATLHSPISISIFPPEASWVDRHQRRRKIDDHSGACVNAVDRMTLEDIFVASVQNRRETVAA